MSWDLETSNLNANFGFILCGGYKVLGEKRVHVPKISDYSLYDRDPTNDRELVKTLAKELSTADIWLTWYGSRFDVPYLNSRLIYHGLKPLPPIPHIDGWRIARYQMRLNSNRLQSVTQFLELEDKTPLSGPHWIKAMAGNKRSLKYVVDHCRQDVVVLEQVYERIRPLAVNHPNVNLVAPIDGKDRCPRCGSDRLQKRGFSIAKVAKTQRYQCMSCGGWSRGKPQRIAGVEVR